MKAEEVTVGGGEKRGREKGMICMRTGQKRAELSIGTERVGEQHKSRR